MKKITQCKWDFFVACAIALFIVTMTFVACKAPEYGCSATKNIRGY